MVDGKTTSPDLMPGLAVDCWDWPRATPQNLLGGRCTFFRRRALRPLSGLSHLTWSEIYHVLDHLLSGVRRILPQAIFKSRKNFSNRKNCTTNSGCAPVISQYMVEAIISRNAAGFDLRAPVESRLSLQCQIKKSEYSPPQTSAARR